MGTTAKSKKRKQQGQCSPAQDGETVVRVVVDNMPASCLQQQLVCTLLVSSRATAQSVHCACIGRLPVSLPMLPPWRSKVSSSAAQQKALSSEVAKQGQLYCGWLARNGQLLSELQVSLWPDQEEAMAAGLAAAAAGQGSAAARTLLNARTSRRRSPSAAIAAAAAADAQAAAVDSAQGQQHGLPLSALRCLTPITGDLLCSLHGSSHLSTLELAVSSMSPKRQLSAALAGLSGLKQLTLINGDDISSMRRPVSLEPVSFALGQLTQLTELQLRGVLAGFSYAPDLSGSLVELHMDVRTGWLPNLSALTALKKLQVPFLRANEAPVLPTNITALHLGVDPSKNITHHYLQPLLVLQQLQELHISMNGALSAQQLQLLTQLTQLQQLHLEYKLEELKRGDQAFVNSNEEEDRVHGAFERLGTTLCEEGPLPALPLKHLHLDGFYFTNPYVIDGLGLCSQLTNLCIRNGIVAATPRELAQQLQQLSTLRVLELTQLELHYSGSSTDSDSDSGWCSDDDGCNTDSDSHNADSDSHNTGSETDSGNGTHLGYVPWYERKDKDGCRHARALKGLSQQLPNLTVFTMKRVRAW